jgi:hypothetical protein
LLQTIVPQRIERLAEALDQAAPIHDVERLWWDALSMAWELTLGPTTRLLGHSQGRLRTARNQGRR